MSGHKMINRQVAMGARMHREKCNRRVLSSLRRLAHIRKQESELMGRVSSFSRKQLFHRVLGGSRCQVVPREGAFKGEEQMATSRFPVCISLERAVASHALNNLASSGHERKCHRFVMQRSDDHYIRRWFNHWMCTLSVLQQYRELKDASMAFRNDYMTLMGWRVFQHWCRCVCCMFDCWLILQEMTAPDHIDHCLDVLQDQAIAVG